MKVEGIRVFMPCKDFDESQAFYKALGFKLSMAGDDLCIAENGECSFFLQRYYSQEFAENTMLQIIVADIHDAFEVISGLGGNTRFKPIEQERWGKVIYLWGPAGELLHITELNH